MNPSAGGLFLLLMLLHPGCATFGTVSSHRLQSDILAGPNRVALERQSAAEFDQTLVRKGAIVNDAVTTQMLSDMVNKLARTSHRPQAHFTVRLIRDKSPNAFSIGGEYVYVHQGLLTFAGSNKNALAGVLAHEISHDIAGHSSRGLTAQKWQALATEIVTRATKSKVAAAVTQTAGTLVYLKYTRSQEQEADILGAVYAYRAGYDPKAFVQFFQSLEKQAALPGFLTFVSDHPSYKTRIQTINLTQDYLRGRITIPQIDAADHETANVLSTVSHLDQMQRRGKQVFER